MVLLLACLMMQAPDVTERVSVEYVLLDILAFDRKGNPVTDLSQDDFEVREGRQKVDITFFEKLDMRTVSQYTFSPETIEGEGEQVVQTGATRQRQQIVLAVDLEAIPHIDVARTFDLLDDFVDTLDPAFDYGIEVMSLEYGSYTKGFTESRSLVAEALTEMRERYLNEVVPGRGQDTLLGHLDRGGQRKDRRQIDNSQTLTDVEERLPDCMKLARNLPEAEICMNDVISQFIDNQFLRARRVIMELQSMAERFDDDKQLKTILLVSPGFSVEGLDSLFDLRDAMLSGSSNPGMSAGSSRALFRDRAITEEYQTLLHNCMANRIVIHVFDIYGNREVMRRQNSAEYRSPAGNQISAIYNRYNDEVTSGSLSVAEDTGGTFTRAFGLGKPFTKVIERSRFSYQVGYSSPSGKPGKWRKIKIKCKRKGVRLQYRAGYYGS